MFSREATAAQTWCEQIINSVQLFYGCELSIGCAAIALELCSSPAKIVPMYIVNMVVSSGKIF